LVVGKTPGRTGTWIEDLSLRLSTENFSTTTNSSQQLTSNGQLIANSIFLIKSPTSHTIQNAQPLRHRRGRPVRTSCKAGTLRVNKRYAEAPEHLSIAIEYPY
jgi:hypothetical protein